MSSTQPKRTALICLALTAIALTGCEKTSEQKKAAIKAQLAAITPATEQQAAEATKAVQAAWAGVEQKVRSTYKPSADEMSFYLDLAILTKHPHRLTGYGAGQEDAAGSLFAGKYVENRLLSMGFKEVVTQEFPVVQPVTTECEIVINGQSHAIYAARPNILQATITPPEGIVGKTLYVGQGETEDYGTTLPEDRIVVIDFDSGDNWQNAFAFGARAVIFVDTERRTGKPYHHVNVPANLPRFYVGKKLAEELRLTGKPQTVKLLAKCDWQQLRGRNVVTVVRGTDPKFSPERPDQAIVLAAPLDSLSEVPLLSPGAREAANCAALLKIAEHFKDNPPKRDVIICFFDGQAQNHMGARAFYGAMFRRMGNRKITARTLEDRLARLDEERTYLLQLRDIIDAATPLAQIWGQWAELTDKKNDLLEQKEQVQSQKADLAVQISALAEKSDTLGKNAQPDSAAIERVNQKLASLQTEAQQLEASIPDRLVEIDESVQLLDEQIAKLETEMATPEMQSADLFLSESVRQMPRHDHTIRFLREEAKNFDSDVLDKLRPLRIKHNEFIGHRKQLADQVASLTEAVSTVEEELANATKTSEDFLRLTGELDAARQEAQEAQDKLASIDVEMAAQEAQIEILNDRDVGWNSLIRDLFEEKLVPSTRGRFARVMTEGRNVLNQRLGELDELTAQADKALILRNSFGPKHNAIVLHVSINLGDTRDKWTFIHGDSTGPLNDDKTGNYSAIFRAMRNIFKSNHQTFSDFEARAVSESYDNKWFCPAIYADSAAIAKIFAIFNLSAMTSLERLPRQGLPSDTLESLDTARMRTQLSQLEPFLGAMASHAGLNIPPSIRPQAHITEGGWSSNKATGPSVKQAGAGSAMPNRPVRGAVVAVIRQHASGPWAAGRLTETPPGFVFPILARTDTNGIFEMGPYSQHKNNYKAPRTFVATFDKTPIGQGEIPKGYASRGLITAVVSTKKFGTASGKFGNKAVDLFQTRGKTVIGYGYNRGSIASITMRAQSTAKFRDDRHLACEIGNILTVYAPHEAKGLKVFNKTGPVLLNNKPTKTEYQGRGISLDDPFQHPVLMRDAAHDLMVLNTYRLKLLRNSRITQESLERLNGEATDIRADAMAASLTPWDGTAGDLESSAALSRRGYPFLVAVMNDLVTAVVLLLLLAMPFAYALERLLIGTPHIYRQIGWFTFFFLVTFAVLFTVNPAFQIAATPIIIFLAFTIILLSVLVIFIMVRKLQVEIKKMQGLGTTVHSADVSRLGTMSAAINMGISTMRRRPVRTLLTAATVVLLTFTILTFASFGSSWDIRETYEGPMTGRPHRVLVRHQLWSTIGQSLVETLRGHFRDEATVVPRYWVSPTAQQVKEIQQNTRDTMEFLVASGNTEKISPVAAAIGLDMRDLQMQPHLKALFEQTVEGGTTKSLANLDILEDGIILTEAVRDELGLGPEDIGKAKVILAGRELTYAGIVSDELGTFSLLDGSKMLPVDYQASGGSSMDAFTQESSSESLSELPDVESAQFVTFNVDQVVIVSPKTAKGMNGDVRAITVYPHDVQDIDRIARRSAKVAELPAYMGGQTGVKRMIFTTLAEASGAKDLLIPVLLGGMIVFATMLGSVSDREREIYTFSSLGLAPAHVAGLFFAEASVYAVVGGMGGYLLGQIVARALGYMASLGWVTVPSMNYSSTNAIVTVLIVMGTVLISTIYPAMKASRSANPGIQRAWKIPAPDGNLYDLIFPFTVSAYDIIGVVSFLKEHFDNYSDTSLGVFTSMECHIFRQQTNDMLGFRASVALAPFDLGVTQNFAVLSQPSDIEGIDEVRIMIYRLSGAHGDWQRSNRVFVNELRRQLLIWRSLTQEIMDRYRQTTLETWDSLPLEEVDRQSIGGPA